MPARRRLPDRAGKQAQQRGRRTSHGCDSQLFNGDVRLEQLLHEALDAISSLQHMVAVPWSFIYAPRGRN